MNLAPHQPLPQRSRAGGRSSRPGSRKVRRLRFRPLAKVRRWLDCCPINTPQQARRICRLIPAQCPFARTIRVFGRTLLRIPPLCKLNPLYPELMALRFRALSYLADECGEDVTAYI